MLFRSNLAWKHTMRARAHFAMDAADEALAEVDSALGVTNDDNLDAETAYLYAIRAQLLLRADNKAGERDLAHAIAIHLAAGEDDEAREERDRQDATQRGERSGTTNHDFLHRPRVREGRT